MLSEKDYEIVVATIRKRIRSSGFRAQYSGKDFANKGTVKKGFSVTPQEVVNEAYIKIIESGQELTRALLTTTATRLIYTGIDIESEKTAQVFENTREQVCFKCKELLPSGMFKTITHKGGKRTLFSYCKNCESVVRKKIDKKYYDKNKPKISCQRSERRNKIKQISGGKEFLRKQSAEKFNKYKEKIMAGRALHKQKVNQRKGIINSLILETESLLSYKQIISAQRIIELNTSSRR